MYRITAVVAMVAAASAAAVSTAVPALTTASASTTTDNCSTRSVCADYINECGIMYGGCFADCKPWPTFTPPPCPSNSSSSTASTTGSEVSVTTTSSRRACSKPTASSSSKPCGGDVECVTSYRHCSATQLPFGGCYPACSPRPLYTPPPCPQVTVSLTTSSVPAASPSSKPCGGDVACVTSYRHCPTTQVPFGGCYPACSPRPFYTPPPCPVPTSSAA